MDNILVWSEILCGQTNVFWLSMHFVDDRINCAVNTVDRGFFVTSFIGANRGNVFQRMYILKHIYSETLYT